MGYTYHVELTDNDETVDIYGYEDQVVAWTNDGSFRAMNTDGLYETRGIINHLVSELKENDFKILNLELKGEPVHAKEFTD